MSTPLANSGHIILEGADVTSLIERKIQKEHVLSDAATNQPGIENLYAKKIRCLKSHFIQGTLRTQRQGLDAFCSRLSIPVPQSHRQCNQIGCTGLSTC